MHHGRGRALEDGDGLLFRIGERAAGSHRTGSSFGVVDGSVRLPEPPEQTHDQHQKDDNRPEQGAPAVLLSWLRVVRSFRVVRRHGYILAEKRGRPLSHGAQFYASSEPDIKCKEMDLTEC